MDRPRVTWLAAVLLALIPGENKLRAETVALRPVADTDIREFNAPFNFGTAPDMVCGVLGVFASEEVRRALLKFDLAGQIPSGVTITSATLTVVVTKVPGFNGGSGPTDSNFNLRRILQDWTETGASWNNRLSVVTPWQAPGAAGANDVSSTVSASVFVTGQASYTFASALELVADAQFWLDNPAANFGWRLASDNETTEKTARHFGARENVNTNDAPLLVVGYTVATPPAAPQIDRADLAGNEFRLIFTAQASQSYTVEFRDSLSIGNWITFTNIAAPATTTSIVVTNPVAGGSRFFRLATP